MNVLFFFSLVWCYLSCQLRIMMKKQHTSITSCVARDKWHNIYHGKYLSIAESNVMNCHVWKYIFTNLIIKYIKADIYISQCMDHDCYSNIYYSIYYSILTTLRNNMDIIIIIVLPKNTLYKNNKLIHQHTKW